MTTEDSKTPLSLSRWFWWKHVWFDLIWYTTCTFTIWVKRPKSAPTRTQGPDFSGFSSIHCLNSRPIFPYSDLSCTHVEIPDWMSELGVGESLRERSGKQLPAIKSDLLLSLWRRWGGGWQWWWWSRLWGWGSQLSLRSPKGPRGPP